MSEPDFEGLPVIDTGDEPKKAPARARSPWPMYLGLGVLGVAVVGVLVWLHFHFSGGQVRVAKLVPIEDCAAVEGRPLEFQALIVNASSEQPSSAQFFLAEAPKGAVIDPESGRFSWTPTEQDGGREFAVRLRLASAEPKQTLDERRFTIRVREHNEKPVIEEIPVREAKPGETVEIAVAASDPDDPPRELEYVLVGRNPSGVTIDRATGRLQWPIPEDIRPGTVSLGIGVREVGPSPASAKGAVAVRIAAAEPSDPVSERTPIPEPEPAPAPQVAEESAEPKRDPDAAASAAEDAILLKHFDDNDYFLPKQYPVFRKVYAERFERENRDTLATGYGANAAAVAKLFEASPELRETFYTALDPERDKIGPAARLFGELVAAFPDAFPAHGELAIATAAVWDDEGAVYSYEGHQRRTKSSLPEGRIGAVANFQYWLDCEPVMQGRGRFLPWEFLTHTVNHRTPLNERKWAQDNYLSKRVMIGKCYGEVPYDVGMLESGSETAKLNDHPYNLPNLLRYGGVCAMQADFASRVAKSLGVPAAYVSGESRSGDRHAWVMWVELLNASAKQIEFELQSHGRYLGDLYYVGTLEDPVSGKPVTDRQLEMRLHTVGLNRDAKRHAELIMKTWPLFEKERPMDVGQQIAFLDRVIRLCPGNEQAWHSLADLASSGEVEPRHRKVVGKILDSLFTTFAAFPDFTWEIFPNLVGYEDNPQRRRQLFERAIALYVARERPDLACEAVLHFADELAARQEYQVAAQGLSSTILAFPTEGRYVPRMIDRLEAIAPEVRDGDKNMVKLYETLLPRVPKLRGNRPSKYCIEMIEKAIPRFQSGGRAELAAIWTVELQKLKAAN